MSKYDNAVARGAKWLDEVQPGWFLNTKLDGLNSVRMDYCVADIALGKGGWDRVFLELPHSSGHYGFNADVEEDEKMVEAWHKLIAHKRHQHAHLA